MPEGTRGAAAVALFLCLVAPRGLAPSRAVAVAPGSAPAAMNAPEVGLTDGDGGYRRALESFARSYAKGTRPELAAAPFARLTWVERTALLNVACAIDGAERCLAALELGLTDNALVVRDHAFRMLVALPVASAARREAAAQEIVGDDRNYRKGQGLWIVDRARKLLDGQKKAGATSLRARRSR